MIRVFTLRRDIDAEFNTAEVEKFLKKYPRYQIISAAAPDQCTLFVVAIEKPLRVNT